LWFLQLVGFGARPVLIFYCYLFLFGKRVFSLWGGFVNAEVAYPGKRSVADLKISSKFVNKILIAGFAKD